MQDEDMYWSNDIGWVIKEQADQFSEHDKESMFLPDGGIWEEV